jgi:sulfite reductase (NADPH) flavoprotein alpha-component
VPEKVSVRQLFSQYLDLNGLPPKALFKAFYDVANAEGKARIGELLNEAAPKLLEDYLADTNSAEVIEEFSPFGVPPLDRMLSALSRMQPRLYSVASAPSTTEGCLELLVLDVHFGRDNHRYGIGTHFLATPNLKSVPIACKPGVFRYPRELDKPVLMLAVGGGLSTMMGLIQHRQSVQGKVGPALVFFASRYRSSYPLLMQKLARFKETGVVQDVFCGFSREATKKMHIQDLLKENSEKVWELWQDSRTELFFCGPARGLPDDIKDVLVKITINEGWLSMEEAMAVSARHTMNFEAYGDA